MAIEHELICETMKVEEPLLVTEIRCGLAASPQVPGKSFVGLTFSGYQGAWEGEEAAGDIVLTLELAESLQGLLAKAIAKARGGNA